MANVAKDFKLPKASELNFANAFNRAIAVLTNPVAELNKVKGEKLSRNDLLIKYVAVLGVLSLVGYLVGNLLGGLGVMAVVAAIIYYILAVAGVWVIAFVLNMLAPNFKSQQNENNAMKLAAYGSTPWLIGGILAIIPWGIGYILAFLLGLYGLYIYFLGLPILMGTPKDQQMVYFIVTLVAVLVIYTIVFAIVNAITVGSVIAQYPTYAGYY